MERIDREVTKLQKFSKLKGSVSNRVEREREFMDWNKLRRLKKEGRTNKLSVKTEKEEGAMP